MRVLELSLRNYRIFEEVDLELPARVIGIFGENGAGKSSLMESIAFACYGVDAARTKKHEIRTHGILTDCLVRLVFEHAGQQYEVRRTIKGKGHTPEAELFGGDMLLASGTTEVDAEIRRLLHMDLHVFRASVYAEQKQLDAFSDVTPGRRKEMALRLLGIRPVEEARNASRREARATKESAVQLAGAVADLAALEAELKDAKEATAEAKHLAKAAAAELKGTIAVEKAATRAFAESDAVRQRIETLTVELRAKTEQRGHASEQQDALAERVQRMTEALAELPAIEEQLGELAGIEERLRLGSGLAERSAELAKTRAQLEAVPEIDERSVLAALGAAGAALSRWVGYTAALACSSSAASSPDCSPSPASQNSKLSCTVTSNGASGSSRSCSRGPSGATSSSSIALPGSLSSPARIAAAMLRLGSVASSWLFSPTRTVPSARLSAGAAAGSTVASVTERSRCVPVRVRPAVAAETNSRTAIQSHSPDNPSNGLATNAVARPRRANRQGRRGTADASGSAEGASTANGR